jgi:hypothetical protein
MRMPSSIPIISLNSVFRSELSSVFISCSIMPLTCW